MYNTESNRSNQIEDQSTKLVEKCLSSEDKYPKYSKIIIKSIQNNETDFLPGISNTCSAILANTEAESKQRFLALYLVKQSMDTQNESMTSLVQNHLLALLTQIALMPPTEYFPPKSEVSMAKNFYQLLFECIIFWTKWYGQDSKFGDAYNEIEPKVTLPHQYTFFTKSQKSSSRRRASSSHPRPPDSDTSKNAFERGAYKTQQTGSSNILADKTNVSRNYQTSGATQARFNSLVGAIQGLLETIDKNKEFLADNLKNHSMVDDQMVELYLREVHENNKVLEDHIENLKEIKVEGKQAILEKCLQENNTLLKISVEYEAFKKGGRSDDEFKATIISIIENTRLNPENPLAISKHSTASFANSDNDKPRELMKQERPIKKDFRSSYNNGLKGTETINYANRTQEAFRKVPSLSSQGTDRDETRIRAYHQSDDHQRRLGTASFAGTEVNMTQSQEQTFGQNDPYEIYMDPGIRIRTNETLESPKSSAAAYMSNRRSDRENDPAYAEVEHIKRQYRQLQADYEYMKRENMHMADDFHRVKKEMERLNYLYTTYSVSNEQLRTENEVYRKLRQALLAENDHHTRQMSELQHELDKLRQKLLDQEISPYNSPGLQNLQSFVSNTQEEYNELQSLYNKVTRDQPLTRLERDRLKDWNFKEASIRLQEKVQSMLNAPGIRTPPKKKTPNKQIGLTPEPLSDFPTYETNDRPLLHDDLGISETLEKARQALVESMSMEPLTSTAPAPFIANLNMATSFGPTHANKALNTVSSLPQMLKYSPSVQDSKYPEQASYKKMAAPIPSSIYNPVSSANSSSYDIPQISTNPFRADGQNHINRLPSDAISQESDEIGQIQDPHIDRARELIEKARQARDKYLLGKEPVRIPRQSLPVVSNYPGSSPYEEYRPYEARHIEVHTETNSYSSAPHKRGTSHSAQKKGTPHQTPSAHKTLQNNDYNDLLRKVDSILTKDIPSRDISKLDSSRNYPENRSSASEPESRNSVIHTNVLQRPIDNRASPYPSRETPSASKRTLSHTITQVNVPQNSVSKPALITPKKEADIVSTTSNLDYQGYRNEQSHVSRSTRETPKSVIPQISKTFSSQSKPPLRNLEIQIPQSNAENFPSTIKEPLKAVESPSTSFSTPFLPSNSILNDPIIAKYRARLHSRPDINQVPSQTPSKGDYLANQSSRADLFTKPEALPPTDTQSLIEKIKQDHYFSRFGSGSKPPLDPVRSPTNVNFSTNIKPRFENIPSTISQTNIRAPVPTVPRITEKPKSALPPSATSFHVLDDFPKIMNSQRSEPHFLSPIPNSAPSSASKDQYNNPFNLRQSPVMEHRIENKSFAPVGFSVKDVMDQSIVESKLLDSGLEPAHSERQQQPSLEKPKVEDTYQNMRVKQISGVPVVKFTAVGNN